MSTSTESTLDANAATFFVERHRKAGYAAKPAYIEYAGQQRRLDYAGLAQASDQVGGGLIAQGIRPDDRLALLLPDQLEWPILFWGCVKQRIQPVALNTLLSTDIYQQIFNDSGVRAICVSVSLLPVAAPAIAACTSIEKIFVVADPDSACQFEELVKQFPDLALLDYHSTLAQADVASMQPARAEECAFWLYSSGSTGTPKGVRHRHSSLKATADTYGTEVLGIRQDDIVYSAAKLFFAYGLGNAMTFPLAVGATTWLMNGRPTPDSVLDLIQQAQPSLFFGVPTLYAALLEAVSRQSVDLSCLRLCVSAGEALPADIGKRWEQLSGADVLDGVGSTEMLHIFLSNRPGAVEHGTSGVAVPGYELRLVDETGEPAAVGTLGELLVRGPSTPIDYWQQPEKSAYTFADGWARTGDKYEQRDDGRLLYCGRTDDMFKSGGIWVSPFEVEQVLIEHEQVLEAAVVPALDENGLDKPKAFIVLVPTTQDDTANLAEQQVAQLQDELKQHVQARIGKWKYPRWVEIMPDLPKTATGKVQRFKLRQTSGEPS